MQHSNDANFMSTFDWKIAEFPTSSPFLFEFVFLPSPPSIGSIFLEPALPLFLSFLRRRRRIFAHLLFVFGKP